MDKAEGFQVGRLPSNLMPFMTAVAVWQWWLLALAASIDGTVVLQYVQSTDPFP